MDRIYRGACRCGELRFKVSAPPVVTMACHCTGCQRMTSSAYSLSVLFPSETFEIEHGEPVIGGMRADPVHHFCPKCLSWVYTSFSNKSQFVNVRTTMLDDAAEFAPFFESFTSEKLPWAEVAVRHSFEKFPPNEIYPDLIAEFAATRSA